MGARADALSARHPRPILVWSIGISGCLASALVGVLAYRLENDGVPDLVVPDPVVQAVFADWVVLSYVLAGLVAWNRRPVSRIGPLMVAAGFAAFVSQWSWTSPGLPFAQAVPFTIGQMLNLLPPVLFLHVFLAYPSGRLTQRAERILVWSGYASVLGFGGLHLVLGGAGPRNLLAVFDRPGVARDVLRVELVIVSVICVGGIGVLVARRRRGGRPLRRSIEFLIDSFEVGLVMIPALLVTSAIEGQGPVWLRRATFFVIGAAPLAYLAGILQARLARSAVTDFCVAMGTDPGPHELQTELGRALRDPSLRLAYWMPEFESWADPDGRKVNVSALGDDRAATYIDREQGRLAVLLHDAALRDEPELLGGICAAAGVALDNTHLNAQLRARLEELRGSRARILDAALTERKRLERNLHDGAQQRLIALSLDLSLLESKLGSDPESQEQLGAARREIAISLGELREISHGLHPAVVSGHGLPVALEQLVARAHVPFQLNIRVGRLPEPVEVAAYFVVSECLANTGKHAKASSGRIDVTRRGSDVLIEVTDDGVGGADTERGSGLRGLADRVEALGGRLRVWSPAGGGTRVMAEIPCG